MINGPVSELDEADPRMNLYVARCTTWMWHDADLIDIVDANGHVVITLDRCQTWIFHEADGGRTVRSLLAWISYHYRENQARPPDLEGTVFRVLIELVEDLRVLKLCKKGPVLPDYLLRPWTRSVK